MTRKFDFAYGRFTWFLFGLLGMAPASSGMEVTAETIRVRMSWAFSAEFPRSSIVAIRRGRAGRYGLGVHGWRGTWAVNGRLDVVWADIDPPARARVMFFRVNLRRLGVSLEDPEGFAEELGLRVAAG